MNNTGKFCQLHHNRDRALKMFESGDGVDCVIELQECDGQQKTEFNVHKFVLATNSDVFHAMFSHKNTKEFRESRIEIKDSTATAVHQMLHYMYAGTLPKEYDVEKDALPLLKIADKYQIHQLMDLNEKKLIGSITKENVFDRLELANIHQISTLKSACGKKIRRNLTELKKTDKWNELKESSPKLAFSVLEGFPNEGTCTCPHSDDSDGWDD